MYEITIKSESPLIMHNGAAGLDTRSTANIEKATLVKKKGSNRTVTDEARIRELDCQTSLWLDARGAATIPPGAIRRMIENAARKTKQGGDVREGLIVTAVKFDYDREALGETIEDLGRKAQHTVGVVVMKARILRTRAKFDEWSATFVVDAEPELVDKQKLASWLEVGSRRVGLGDWRPEKSGHYGRFTVESVKEIDKLPEWA